VEPFEGAAVAPRLDPARRQREELVNSYVPGEISLPCFRSFVEKMSDPREVPMVHVDSSSGAKPCVPESSIAHRVGRFAANDLLLAIFATVVAGCSGASGASPAPSGAEATGQIEASLTQIPSGVQCVQVAASRGGVVSTVTVMSGQSSAALSIGPLLPGSTTLQASAFNLACASVTSSTTPDWIGSAVSIEVKPGVTQPVTLSLFPNAPTSVAVNFVFPAAALGSSFDANYAISATGSVRAWGINDNAELADGTTTNRSSPVASTLLSNVASINGGQFHACAVTTAGALLCWGYNGFGQLGDGTTNNRFNPVQAIASGVKQVAAARSSTCILKTDSTASCVGFNVDGELGNGTTTNSLAFTAVSGLGSTVDQITAGYSAACVKTNVGTVSCWGTNSYGQLGTGVSGSTSSVPVLIPNFSGVAQVATQGQHVCARKVDGTVWCWGGNFDGQLGDGTTVDRNVPVQVVGITTAVQIAVGMNHSCARLQDGTVRCWGQGFEGELGDGSGKNSSTPVSVRGLTGAALEITVGRDSTCARVDSGTVQCWGVNTNGEVGDGTTSYRYAATSVAW
jgi:alpha-tubulin suppressor-like RCC1 family protein